MASARTTWILVAIVCGFGTGGCITRHLAQPIEVKVRDADTGQPIPGATVELKLRPSIEGESVKGVADDKGKAVVKVKRSQYVAYEKPVWQASAPGYLTVEERSQQDLSRTTARQISLHRGPAKIVVTVPVDYQGPILIDKLLREKWLQLQQGKREFEYRAEVNGYVAIDASPLMMKWLDDAQVRIVDDEGKQIPESSIRRVVKTPTREILVVGSEKEASEIRQVVYQQSGSGKDPKKLGEDPEKIEWMFRKYREECGMD